MAQTIKELEKERAGILKEIEKQAQKNTKTTNKEPEHSLNDWLNAAENVVPANYPNNSNSQPAKITKPVSKVSRSPFFIIIITISLLLIFIGIFYIASLSINNQLNSLQEQQTKSATTIQSLQDTVITLETTITTLEQDIILLKKPTTTIITKQQADQPKAIDEQQLDNKLKKLSAQLEGRLGELLLKLEGKKTLADDKAVIKELAEKISPMTAKTTAKTESSSIPEPTPPVVPVVKPVNQPVIRLLKRITPDPITKEEKKPVIAKTANVKWLLKQPAFNYTLQLASMRDKESLQKFIKDKSLTNSKIIHQQHSSGLRHVVITGSYLNRRDANKARHEHSEKYGVSPWVRKMKDIQDRVD